VNDDDLPGMWSNSDLTGGETDMPQIRCQRCGSYGATVHYGWALLCSGCRGNDDDE
jgi:hypothetical protein